MELHFRAPVIFVGFVIPSSVAVITGLHAHRVIALCRCSKIVRGYWKKSTRTTCGQLAPHHEKLPCKYTGVLSPIRVRPCLKPFHLSVDVFIPSLSSSFLCRKLFANSFAPLANLFMLSCIHMIRTTTLQHFIKFQFRFHFYSKINRKMDHVIKPLALGTVNTSSVVLEPNDLEWKMRR